MDNYWALYDNKHFNIIQKQLKLYPEDNHEIDNMYRTYYDLFPCDKFRELPHICLLLFFYYTEPINATHDFILYNILFNELPYNAAVYLVVKLENYYTNQIRKINRHSISTKQFNLRSDFLKFANVCMDNVRKIENNIDENDWEKLFKGTIKFSAPIAPRSGRQSLRQRLPDIDDKKMIESVSQFQGRRSENDRLFEVWETFIEEDHPNKVCVSKKNSFLFTTIPNETNELEPELHELVSEFIRNENGLELGQNLSLPIDEIIKCNKPIFVSELSIRYDNNTTGHANSLVFEFDSNGGGCIYRFEPHGVDGFNDNVIEKEIRKRYSYLDDFVYIGTTKTCPYSPHGVQSIEALLEDSLKRPQDVGGAGFCFIWSLIYLEYVIINAGVMSPDQIHNYMIRNVENLTQMMYEFTYKLLQRYHEMLDENYPFRNIYKLNETKNMLIINQRVIDQIYTGAENFDVTNDNDLQLLYKNMYSGHIHINTIIKKLFQLKKYLFETTLENIKNLLESLKEGTLYRKLLEINKEHTDHNSIPLEFLPRAIIYYKSIVKNSFQEYIERNEIIDKEGETALKQMYRKYFHESLK